MQQEKGDYGINYGNRLLWEYQKSMPLKPIARVVIRFLAKIYT